jgi:RNA polymerase sigma-70 factor (ECF subfamily)
MHRVCKNLWIDQIIKTARISVPGAEMIERTLEPVDGESIAIDRLRMDEVANAMQQLDSDHRLVLALVTIEGYSYREAAEIMDVPIGTVMSRLSRARTRLLELM